MNNQIIKLVEIVNTNNSPTYLPMSIDERDTIVVPPKGTMTLKLTDAQIEKLKNTKLQFKIKG
jgi:hypothetical protein